MDVFLWACACLISLISEVSAAILDLCVTHRASEPIEGRVQSLWADLGPHALQSIPLSFTFTRRSYRFFMSHGQENIDTWEL